MTSAFAKRFWGDAEAIGHRMTYFNERNSVLQHRRRRRRHSRARACKKPPIEEAYFPIVGPPGTTQWFPFRYMHFVVRAPSMSSTALVARVRQVVTQMDPQVPIADIMPMEIVVANSMAQTSFTMLLLLIAAGIALMLSAVGIYGVISYVVGQRRGEIGIRMALGAQVTEVSRMIVVQSFTLAGAGVIVGIVAAVRVDAVSAVAAVRGEPGRSVRSRGNGACPVARVGSRQPWTDAAGGEDRPGRGDAIALSRDR